MKNNVVGISFREAIDRMKNKSNICSREVERSTVVIDGYSYGCGIYIFESTARKKVTVASSTGIIVQDFHAKFICNFRFIMILDCEIFYQF